MQHLSVSADIIPHFYGHLPAQPGAGPNDLGEGSLFDGPLTVDDVDHLLPVVHILHLHHPVRDQNHRRSSIKHGGLTIKQLLV